MKTASKILASALALGMIVASSAPALAGGYGFGKRGGYHGYKHAPYGYGHGYGNPIYRKNSRGGLGAGIAIGALTLLGAAAVASQAKASPSYSDSYVPANDTYRQSYGGYSGANSNEYIVAKYRSMRNGIVCETNYGRLLKC